VSNKKGRSEYDDEEEQEDEIESNEEDIMEIESVVSGPKEEKTGNGDLKTLQEKINNLEAQLEKEKKEQLYLRAEFDTYRRRAIKERSDMLKYAGERIFAGLLGVLDNFERALEVEVKPETIESFRNGVKLIADELSKTLKREGIEEVLPQDDKYDPNVFEAISSEETSEKEPGQITKIFRKAYRLHDRIIRPGQVAVAKAPSDGQQGEEKDGQQEEQQE
jgi:molecular chaperone GrpE